MKHASRSVSCLSVSARLSLPLTKTTSIKKARLVAVEKLPPKDVGVGYGPDAPLNPDVYRWNISVQLGDTIYKWGWERYDARSLG